MRDFEDSTLWRISAFERMRLQTGTNGYQPREGAATVLPTTLLADLRLNTERPEGDVLEVLAACLRHREAALLYLQHDGLVWPVTLFPVPMLYHAPRDLVGEAPQGWEGLGLLSIEPPGVRPPGHWMHERIGAAEHYRPLLPLLWMAALHGPRALLLNEIRGTAAYRAIKSPSMLGLTTPGALGPAVERLKRESVPLRDLARWPGLSVERASRLLNALYLASCLMVTRGHPAARPEPGLGRRLLGPR